MTRKDWWIGIAVLVAALAAHAFTVVSSSRRLASAIQSDRTTSMLSVGLDAHTPRLTAGSQVTPDPLQLDARTPRLTAAGK